MTEDMAMTGPDARAEALLARYERAGYRRVVPAILQPAEPFLDLSGEELRQRIFLTTDPEGRELCLRPDLTIPVSRDYLASARAGEAAGYCYLGPVFRHRGDDPTEFLQAGIEAFGRRDTAAADAEMLALGLEATAHFGVGSPEIRIGDVGLFAALIAALDLAPAWKRRLIKDFNRKASLAHDLDQAQAYLDKGMETDQQNPWLYFLKAQIAEARGNKAEAVEALRTARTLNRQKIAAETGVAPGGPGPTSLTPGASPQPLPPNPFRRSQSAAPLPRAAVLAPATLPAPATNAPVEIAVAAITPAPVLGRAEQLQEVS